MDEHSIAGGRLGAVAKLADASPLGRALRIAITDTFTDTGSYDVLSDRHVILAKDALSAGREPMSLTVGWGGGDNVGL